MKRLSLILLAVCFAIGVASCGNGNQDAAAPPVQTPPSAQSTDVAPASDAPMAMARPAPGEPTLLEKGGKAPVIRAIDIRGQEVDLNKIVKEQPLLIIEFFFTINTGEEIAAKLTGLNHLYGDDKVRIIALGLKEEEAALKAFAEKMQIDYYIIDAAELTDAPWLAQIQTLPFTMLVHPADDMTIVDALHGGSSGHAALISRIAVAFMDRGEPEAEQIADLAVEQGEDKARETKGYVLTSMGKLDEAESEFGAIDSKTGLAKVALERGNYEQAEQLAAEAPADGYAGVIKGEALLRSGKLDEAAASFGAVEQSPMEDWKRSEAIAGEARVMQEKGDLDGSIAKNREAVEMNYYNVVALSNEAAAQRDKGDLGAASKVLEKAKGIRSNDDLVALMLKQVQDELQKANDVARQELIRNQIKDLVARYDELKKEGLDKPLDEWTTRPLIVAFLPGDDASSVIFPRAGTQTVLKREIEARLQEDERVSVVEREMLDKLLQELQLGSSELADPSTQLQLGKVLTARYLGFVEFAQTGADIVMYIRFVDTETTNLAAQVKRNLRGASDYSAVVDGVAAEILTKFVDEMQQQGLIADAPSDDAIMINLGKKHGIAAGQVFDVIEEGEPIEVGGKVIAYRQKRVAELEVTDVEDEYALCKVVNKKEGVTLAKEMKVKEAGGK